LGCKKEKPNSLPGGNNTEYSYNENRYILDIYLNSKDEIQHMNLTISDINEISTKTYTSISVNYINKNTIMIINLLILKVV